MTKQDRRETNFISAVVYMRGETGEILDFFGMLGGVLEQNFEHFEIVAVDDGCAPDLQEKLESFAAALPGAFSLVKMSFPQGVQASMNAGADLAIGDFVMEFEGTARDFPPELIPDAYFRCLSGFDVVSAAPKAKQKLTSRIFYRIYNKYSGSACPLFAERFRVVSRRAVNRVESMSDNLVYRKAFYRDSGLRCDAIGYRPEKEGAESAPAPERGKLAADSLILFTTVAYRLSLLMTILMMTASAASMIYTASIFLFRPGRPIEGWTTTMMFLSFGFFGVFAILTIVIKYLSVLVELTFKKTRYTVESVRKFS